MSPCATESAPNERAVGGRWRRGRDELPSLALEDVGAGCRHQGRVGCAADPGWRNLAARAWPQPLQPIRPPAAIVAGGTVQPGICGRGRAVISPVAPATRGRIDDSSNMAAATDHKTRLAAGQLGNTPG